MITYKLNKKNIFIVVTILTIFGIFGILFFVSPTTFVSAFIRSATLIKFIGFFLSVFSILLLVGYITLLFDNYGFKMTEKGIINNTNLTNVGIVYWKDITKIKIKKLKKIH